RGFLEGEEFKTEVVFKRWPTSGMLHPYIEACLALRKDGMKIKSVHATVTPDVKPWVDPARRRPTNAATAANSLFFCVSKALLNREVTLADFTAKGLAQPGLDIEHSVGDRPAVDVMLQDGQTLRAKVEAKPQSMSYEALAAKFRD